MRTKMVLRWTAGVLLILGAGHSGASAQAAKEAPSADIQQEVAEIGPSSVSEFSCHNLGSGDSVCFSNHGNISRFKSPSAFEHIAVGYIGEGYSLCSSVGISGYDAGADESGFGTATVNQPNGVNTFPLTITRDTTDGFFRLQQTFSRDTAEKDVTVTMKLTNLSRSVISEVLLVRYFDGDIDGDISDDRYAQTTDSVWGWDDTTGHGLMLTAQSFAVPHFMAAEPFSSWDPRTGGVATHCDIGGVTTPTAPGDFVGAVIYSIDAINPGQSKTVKVLYRRF